MAYIWINPVVNSMYEPSVLDTFLTQNGYTSIEASPHWIDTVKQKYKTLATQTDRTIIDMRCPKIGELVKKYKPSPVTIPDIEPILIHCGREISERTDLRGEEKIITTPCKALADMGNALHLEETRFIPWNVFVLETGNTLPSLTLDKSPIPPGFFEGLGLKHTSISNEEDIRNYFKNYKPTDVQLVEMLFCKNGCHNGDGVRMCEKHEDKK